MVVEGPIVYHDSVLKELEKLGFDKLAVFLITTRKIRKAAFTSLLAEQILHCWRKNFTTENAAFAINKALTGAYSELTKEEVKH